MSWWRHIFDRPPGTLARSPTTSYADTLARLESSDDKIERARLVKLLGTQLENAFSSNANNTQVALWQVENSTRELIGQTNDLISEAVKEARAAREYGARGEAATAELQRMFSTVGEILTGHEAMLANHDQRIANNERRLNASEEDRRLIHRELKEAETQRNEMLSDIRSIKTLLDQRLTAPHDEAQAQIDKELIDFVRQLKREREREGADDAGR